MNLLINNFFIHLRYMGLECEVVSGLAFAAAILLLVVVICSKNGFEGYRSGYLPAWKDTELMTWRIQPTNQHKKSKDWSPIGVAALVPLFGNVLRFDYILEKRVDRGTGSGEYFYRVRRKDNTITLPIVESRELTDNAIISIANASNPYADRMLIRIPQTKEVEKVPPFPEADIVNFP